MTLFSLILSDLGELVRGSLVLPVVASALLSVITADIKRDVHLEWLQNTFHRNAFTGILDVGLSYIYSLIIAFGVLVTIFFIFVATIEVSKALFA